MPESAQGVIDDAAPESGRKGRPADRQASDLTESPPTDSEQAKKSASSSFEQSEDSNTKPASDADKDPATAASDQEEVEPAHTPKEIAASIQERSEMRRSGLDSLEGMTFFGGRTSFSGPASMSGPAAGRDVNIYHFGRSAQATLSAGKVGLERLSQVREVHVAGATYSKAITLLSEEHLLVLRGADGSGRHTSALHMLTQLVGDHVHVIDAQTVTTIGEENTLNDDCGYVAEISAGELSHAYLAALAARLQEQNARLILITSHELPIESEGHSRFVTEHISPDCQEVLRRHIRRDTRRALRAEQILANPQIQAACANIAPAGSAADLAAKILDVTETDNPAEQVIVFLDQIRRQRVRQIIHRSSGENRRARVEALCRGALLISLAVFADMSYVDATAAAEKLADRFITTELAGLGREIFLTRREYLLSQMDFAVISGQVNRRWGMAVTERVKFRDPAFRVAIFDELWQEYDRSLLLLLNWLRDLAVTAPSPEVRVRSAQVIGTLAVREFAFFCDQVLLGWAGSANVRAQEAAATVLETVAVAGKMRDQMNELLTEWCHDGSVRLQQTAILAMGTRLSEYALASTLSNLRDLALRSTGKSAESMREAVRRAVSELYSGLDKRQVVLTLATWATSNDPASRQLARRCMSLLVHFTDPSGRPSLLVACAEHPKLIDPIGAIIASLLAKPEAHNETATQRDTWDALEEWVGAADEYLELVDPLAILLRRLQITDSGLARQLRFYLSLWAFRNSVRSRNELLEGTT